MRKVKRGLAAIMAALLMLPAQSILAVTQTQDQTVEADAAAGDEKKEEKATPGNAQRKEEVTEEAANNEESSRTTKAAPKKSKAVATPSEARKSKAAKDEVKFNTGKHIYCVVSEEDFFDFELGDAYFEEDGSYTINIPEQNPFFPYEVEFTYRDKTERKWFMTPDDSVEVGGHTFYVSAYFDESAVTQMSLSVGGDTVIVYPEEKEFTDDGEEGIDPASLLPLDTKNLTVDLTGYTPLELTMVSVDDLFIGNELADGDKVMWSRRDDYTISMPGDKLDLSYNTYSSYSYSSGVYWTMIVGEDNQLAANNIRYDVNVKVTPSEDWLIPSIYFQDSEGKRIEKELRRTYYSDYDDRELEIDVYDEQEDEDEIAYVSLSINDTLFPNVNYDQIKVYLGEFTSVEEALSGIDITDDIFGEDMTQMYGGCPVMKWHDTYITMFAFDADGNVVGCLPLNMYVETYTKANHISWYSLVAKYGDSTIDVENSSSRQKRDGVDYINHTLYKNYAADGIYYQQLRYVNNSEEKSEIIAAYVGKYATIQEAVAAGAEDIKDELFTSPGYGADYSNGIMFSIFAGEDSVNVKEIYYWKFQTERGEVLDLSSSTWVYFHGLVDHEGNNISLNMVDDEDSYADGSYITMLVDKNVDLSSLAPEFSKNDVTKLYAEGSKEPEVSGKSFHDFSHGPVQYTVSAEDGIALKNIWLQVVKAGVGNGGLYINSLADEDAKTKVENGVTYSTREMIIDGRYDYQHDIVLINLGSEAIPSISVDLVSDEVELDNYWTLKGDYALPDIDNGETDKTIGYHSPWNLAKIRIRPKEGAADGREIRGTLTIKSGEKELIVLTLTGIVGDPSITTKEIPEAVKYVPYGTMIQNSNKYNWNEVSYQLINGRLPEGMVIRQNGEIYGVPTETGSFTFTVRMRNSFNRFTNSEKTFTLTVIENTDDNVDAATDQGYMLTQRIQDMMLNSVYEQTMVSEGVYDEFVDIFLDGVKLQKDVDYTSESGSTRITIRSETLKANNQEGKHTLGIEFRTKNTKILKRAAQNYEVKKRGTNNENNVNNTNKNSNSGGKNRVDLTKTSSMPRDAKKGYYSTQTGIITGEGEGYSHWTRDELGWKLIYADGTPASGYVAQLDNGTAVEQVLWEQINGVWYAFGITGYLKSGWVYDYQLDGWYCLTEENGMYSGWYGDAEDHCVYYLEPVTGKLAVGWKNIDHKWHYFNSISSVPTWNFNAVTGKWVYNVLSGSKPYGAMYENEYTPDGYYVGVNGIWDEQTEQ